jgi:C-terminal processing protease CtpA/Prc
MIHARRSAALTLALLCGFAVPTAPRVNASSGPDGQAGTPPAPLPAVLAPAALRADVAVLRRALSELHPGLFRYNTPAQIGAGLDALDTEFGEARTPAEAFRAISVLLAGIRCGHTYTNFYNQPREIVAAVYDRQTRVPFHFRWLDRRMIVTRSLDGDERLRPGTEVLAIDGVPVGEILDRLLTIARADGGNDAKRVAQLEITGGARWEAFDVYHPLFYPATGARLRIEARGPGTAATRSFVVDAVGTAKRLAAFEAEQPDTRGAAPVFTVSRPEAGTAVLRMPSWALFNSTWDWRGFLQATFEDLDRTGVTGLVLDLRGNEGGLDAGNEILAHLVSSDLQLQAFVRRVRYQRVPEDLVPHLDTWDRSFFDWGGAAREPAGGFYRLQRATDSAGGDIVRPAAPRFAGTVLALVGASNSSATFQFAQALQTHRLGRLVGQPTGGNQRGINGGAFFFLRLPNSRIEVDIPLIGYFPAEDRPNAGLLPDVPVVPTAEGIAAGIDEEMAAALALLRGAR